MTIPNGAKVLFILLLLVLVGSALLSRRLPLGQALRYIFGWIAIFGAGFLLFTFRDDARPLMDRIRAELNPATPQVEGETVRIAMSADGHFWVDGRIGVNRVRFLIDSGATVTALSRDAISAAGLQIDDTRPAILRTANGEVRADHVRIPELTIGTIHVRDFAAVTSDGFGGTNVLGMNFLSGLRRWGVENRMLILTP